MPSEPENNLINAYTSSDEHAALTARDACLRIAEDMVEMKEVRLGL